MMFGFYGDHMSGWGWVGMSIGMILFWGVFVTAIVLLIRTSGRNENRSDQALSSPTPENLLAERFARGEIDDAEYHDRLATLIGKARL